MYLDSLTRLHNNYAATSTFICLPMKIFIYIQLRIKLSLKSQSKLEETTHWYDLDINVDFIFHCRRHPTISNNVDNFPMLVWFVPQLFFSALGGSLATWLSARLSCATARSQAQAEGAEFMVRSINVPYTLNIEVRLQAWDL